MHKPVVRYEQKFSIALETSFETYIWAIDSTPTGLFTKAIHVQLLVVALDKRKVPWRKEPTAGRRRTLAV